MASLPNQQPPGKQFELRVTASDSQLDTLIAAYTDPTMRSRLPGFLHLFSQRTFSLAITDRDIDGRSETEQRFRAFQMHVTKRTRDKFSLSPELHVDTVERDGRLLTRLRMNLLLGMQATHEIVTPQYFAFSNAPYTPESPLMKQHERAEANGMIPLSFTVPSPVGRLEQISVEKDLRDYLAEKPAGTVDELVLVERAFRHRSHRERQRPQQEPLDATA